MLKGQNIAGSPFAATVTAVEVDAGCSYAAGDGVTAACSGHLVSATSMSCDMRGHMTMPADTAGTHQEHLIASMQATSMNLHEPLTVHASVSEPCKQPVGINMVQHVVLLTTSNEEIPKASHL